MNSLEIDYTTPPYQRLALLLAKIGRKYSEVGLTDPDTIQRKLILRSLLVEPLLAKDRPIIDIGSGVGLPAIPLALAEPDRDVIIVEPNRRAHSLSHWLLSKLPEVNVHHEETTLEAFDFSSTPDAQLVSRATFSFKQLTTGVPGGIEPVIKWSGGDSETKFTPTRDKFVKITVEYEQLTQRFLWAAAEKMFHVKQKDWAELPEITHEQL